MAEQSDTCGGKVPEVDNVKFHPRNTFVYPVYYFLNFIIHFLILNYMPPSMKDLTKVQATLWIIYTEQLCIIQ